MSNSRSFLCAPAQFPKLVESVRSWLVDENFECQVLRTDDGGTLLQVQKKGTWRRFVGMSTALNVVLRQVGGTVNVEIGAGRWIDKAAAGGVSLFVLWPLAVTSAYGAWQQANMPGRVFEHVSGFLSRPACELAIA